MTNAEVSLNERRKALKKFRKEAGFSQAEVASMTGIGQQMLSRFERGDRDLSPEALTRLEQAIADVLSGKQSASQQREEAQKIATLRESDSVKKLLYWFEDPKELQKHRIRVGLSVAQMAERAGIEPSQLEAIENGEQPLEGDTASALWDVVSDREGHGRNTLERLDRFMRAATRDEENAILGEMTSRGAGVFARLLKITLQSRQAAFEKSREEHAEEIKLLKDHIKRLTSPRSLAERRADLEQRMNAADARAKTRQAEHPGPFNALLSSGNWTHEDFVASEEWGRLIEEARQLLAEEKGAEYVAALQGQIAAKDVAVAAQAQEIAALRDLLDLKTREVLLRDALTVEREHSEEK
jgi:transcriptional regulator with XRE-family HTH domain